MQGVKIEELSKIFAVSYKTIYNWFNRRELEGMVGLYNKPGRGCKPTFNPEKKQKLESGRSNPPRQLKQVAQKIKEEWSIEISTKTIQRVLKTVSLSHARMRRGLGGETNPEEYKEKQAQLEEFKRLESQGILDLYYLDEARFSLIPCVSYGRQNFGEYLALPSSRSRRLNVLRIMNRNNHLEAYISFQSINERCSYRVQLILSFLEWISRQ